PQDVERPKTLEKMIELSEKIAKDFVYVRVDWYDVDGQLYFGEITFHHDGGTAPILPKEWDLKLGSKLRLPNNEPQQATSESRSENYPSYAN
ncbi:MAG TPA: ATP-grasp fold amidoligase family protein, partial [Sphingobacteriaceae bacterium]